MASSRMKVAYGLFAALGVAMVIVLVYVLAAPSQTGASEQRAQEYQHKLQELKEQNQNRQKTIAKLEQESRLLDEQVQKYEQTTKADLDKLHNEEQEYKSDLEKYKQNIHFAKITTIISFSLNVLLVIADVAERLIYHSLLSTEELYHDQITRLNETVTNAELYFVDLKILEMITRMKVRKQLLYKGTRDGFSRSALNEKVCGFPSAFLTLITTTSDYTFGVRTCCNWACDGGYLIDDKSASFSIDRLGYADITKGSKSQVDNKDYLLYFGEGDIMVKENRDGVVNPNKAYLIPAPFIADTFYTPEPTFRVSEIEVYNYTLATTG